MLLYWWHKSFIICESGYSSACRPMQLRGDNLGLEPSLLKGGRLQSKPEHFSSEVITIWVPKSIIFGRHGQWASAFATIPTCVNAVKRSKRIACMRLDGIMLFLDPIDIQGCINFYQLFSRTVWTTMPIHINTSRSVSWYLLLSHHELETFLLQPMIETWEAPLERWSPIQMAGHGGRWCLANLAKFCCAAGGWITWWFMWGPTYFACMIIKQNVQIFSVMHACHGLINLQVFANQNVSLWLSHASDESCGEASTCTGSEGLAFKLHVWHGSRCHVPWPAGADSMCPCLTSETFKKGMIGMFLVFWFDLPGAPTEWGPTHWVDGHPRASSPNRLWSFGSFLWSKGLFQSVVLTSKALVQTCAMQYLIAFQVEDSCCVELDPDSYRSENGYKVASYDRDLDGRTMNFNSAPGFALLGWYVKLSLGHPWPHAFPNNQTWPCWIPGLPYGSPWTWPPTPWECLDPTAEAGGCRQEDQVYEVRSTYGAIYFLLGYVEVLKWYLGVLFASRILLQDFSNTWLTIIRGYWNMIWKPRWVLVILILLANHCIWVLEQPRQSLLAHHKRFNWLVNHVCFVAWCRCTVSNSWRNRHVWPLDHVAYSVHPFGWCYWDTPAQSQQLAGQISRKFPC